MGLEDEFFWNLTLPLFLVLWEEYRAQQRDADRRFGEVAAATYNTQPGCTTTWTWEDVFPKHKPKPKPQTDEEMEDVMERLVTMTSKG